MFDKEKWQCGLNDFIERGDGDNNNETCHDLDKLKRNLIRSKFYDADTSNFDFAECSQSFACVRLRSTFHEFHKNIRDELNHLKRTVKYYKKQKTDITTCTPTIAAFSEEKTNVKQIIDDEEEEAYSKLVAFHAKYASSLFDIEALEQENNTCLISHYNTLKTIKGIVDDVELQNERDSAETELKECRDMVEIKK